MPEIWSTGKRRFRVAARQALQTARVSVTFGVRWPARRRAASPATQYVVLARQALPKKSRRTESAVSRGPHWRNFDFVGSAVFEEAVALPISPLRSRWKFRRVEFLARLTRLVPRQ